MRKVRLRVWMTLRDLNLLGGVNPGASETPAARSALIDLSQTCPDLGGGPGGLGPDISAKTRSARRMGLGSLASFMARLACSSVTFLDAERMLDS